MTSRVIAPVRYIALNTCIVTRTARVPLLYIFVRITPTSIRSNVESPTPELANLNRRSADALLSIARSVSRACPLRDIGCCQLKAKIFHCQRALFLTTAPACSSGQRTSRISLFAVQSYLQLIMDVCARTHTRTC